MPVKVGVVRGAENINVTELGMYARLRQYGYSVELVCSTRTWVTEADAGMPARRLPPPPVSGRVAKTFAGGFLIGQVSSYRYLHQFLRGFHKAVADLDVLSPVDLGHPTSYQSILERRYGKKVLLYCADNIPYNWPHDRPLRDHYEAVLDGADHFLALSDGAQRTLLAQGVRAERISRLNVGVDVAFWSPAAVPSERTDGPLRLLFVGRLHWQKGLQTVLEAMELTRSPAELTVLGRGPEEARFRWLLEQRARRGNPQLRERVHFVTERVSAEALRRLRQESHVQLVPSIPTPSWREQMNFAMLEGLACGVPAIASETGGIPEAITDGREGLLVPPDQPLAWANAIDRIAADEVGRRRMSAAARARIVSDYDLEKQGAALAEILRVKMGTAPS
ncbi:MAG TPA: glycosyltransferase family 4 protein [Thermoplasmata archaeon]|nr:glycosyltransferase family 4 protein [Thermoplasmata archaeon]